MRNTTSMRRPASPAPLSMQDKIMSSIRGIVASADLEAAESWSYSNTGTMTVTKPGAFQPLFTINLSFQDGLLNGGVLYPGDQLVNGGPYRAAAGGKVEAVRERTIYARYDRPGELDGAMAMLRKEAQRHAPADVAALDRPAAADLAARMKEIASAESPEAALDRLVAFMAERAALTGDDAMLSEAMEYLEGDHAPAP